MATRPHRTINDCIFTFMRRNLSLIGYPLAIFLIWACIIATAAYLFFSVNVPQNDFNPTTLYSPFGAGAGAVVILLLIIVSSLGHAAFTYAILQHLQERPCRVSAALRAACCCWATLLSWHLINHTVGHMIRAMERSHRSLARIALMLLQATWSICALLVIPVILSENIGPIAAFKRSAQLVKNNKRKTFYALGKYVLFFSIIPILIFLAVSNTVPVTTLIVITIIAIPPLLLFSSFANATFKAALYLQLSGHHNINGFDSTLLQKALR